MSKNELLHIISSIKSLINIDTFLECWENVEIWKTQLSEAEEVLKQLS